MGLVHSLGSPDSRLKKKKDKNKFLMYVKINFEYFRNLYLSKISNTINCKQIFCLKKLYLFKFKF